MTRLAVVTVALAACAHPERPAGRVAEGFVTTADGARLHYRSLGSGGPVVVVPGGCFLEPALAALARARTVVFYDPRNRCRSSAVEDGARISVRADVEDLEALRRHVGAERIVPVGFSYLGRVVALYARSHPERVERLVQIGAVSPGVGTAYPPALAEPRAAWPADLLALDDEVKRLREEGRDRSDPAGFCERYDAFVRRLLVYRPAPAARYTPGCDSHREWPINLDRHLAAIFTSLAASPVPPESVASMRSPVLVVHGRHDRQAPYGAGREWAMAWPDARLVTVAEGAHAPFVDDPSVVDDLDRFLAGSWPERAERVRALDPAAR